MAEREPSAESDSVARLEGREEGRTAWVSTWRSDCLTELGLEAVESCSDSTQPDAWKAATTRPYVLMLGDAGHIGGALSACGTCRQESNKYQELQCIPVLMVSVAAVGIARPKTTSASKCPVNVAIVHDLEHAYQ